MRAPVAMSYESSGRIYAPFGQEAMRFPVAVQQYVLFRLPTVVYAIIWLGCTMNGTSAGFRNTIYSRFVYTSSCSWFLRVVINSMLVAVLGQALVIAGTVHLYCA